MLEDFKSHLLNELPFLFSSKIIIATSSGVDSVVLCSLCKKLDLDFSIAHCDFSLRGEESDIDAKFTEDFAKSLNVLFYQTCAYLIKPGALSECLLLFYVFFFVFLLLLFLNNETHICLSNVRILDFKSVAAVIGSVCQSLVT